jgi:hypothetical protein
MARARRLASWILILVALPLLMGCPFTPNRDDGGGPPPPPPFDFKPRTSPENLLHNLRGAYIEKVIEEYEPLFADDYVFIFNPEDIAEDPTIPDQWGIEEDIRSTRNMFRDPNVSQITLDWVIGERRPSSLDNADVSIEVRNFNMSVFTTDPETGGPLEYRVTNAAAVFDFRKTEEVTAEGDTIWVIVQIVDRGKQ